ncbi:MAG TPA: hypothetical protein VGU25_16310 [Acidobacteriaceae bacterium]|nr:hypothetical protein [Acidobacteriaceae bacterium]
MPTAISSVTQSIFRGHTTTLTLPNDLNIRISRSPSRTQRAT